MVTTKYLSKYNVFFLAMVCAGLVACSRPADPSLAPSTPAPSGPPVAPQQLSATDTHDALRLSWAANSESNISGYQVYYGVDSGAFTHSVFVTGNATSYAFYGLQNRTKYHFIIRAVNTAQEASEFSTEISATPQDITAPGEISSFRITQGVSSGNSTMLRWQNPSNPDFSGVRVLRRAKFIPTSATDSDATVVFEGNASQFQDSGLVSGETYYYRIYTYDGAKPQANYSLGSTALSILILQ